MGDGDVEEQVDEVREDYLELDVDSPSRYLRDLWPKFDATFGYLI